MKTNFARPTAPDRCSCAALAAHAAMRTQQRGVDLATLDCLIAYGRREHDHHGAEVVKFDNAALRRVRRNEPHETWAKASEARSLYAIVASDGLVITAGHRRRRVLRDKGTRQGRAGPRIIIGEQELRFVE